MNWDDARIFLAVAREGQLLGAARRLGVNHATVGRRLGALEASLGTRLVDRRPQGCFLTPDGERLLPRAERIEEEWEAMRAGLDGSGASLGGRVRIGAPDGFGTAFLAPRLAQLLDAHPGLSVELVPVPHAFSLSRREADIAITVDRPDHGRLVSRRLVNYVLGLYASTGYLDRHGRPGEAGDLAGHRLIGPVEELLYSPSVAYAADLGLEWPARFEVSSALGQTEAAVAGAGIAILHGFIASARSDLERVLPDLTVRRSYWLVTHEGSTARPVVRAVGDFIAGLTQAERRLFEEDGSPS